MKRTIVLLLSLLWIPSAAAAVRVVATVPGLAALAKEVGGNKIKVESLSLASQDPHFVDAKPSLALTLNRADLLIAIGLSLEIGWLPNLQTNARNAKIQVGAPGYLECAGAVERREVPVGQVSRAMGDIHPGGNPHYLYDPREAIKCANAIAESLAAIDPGNAATYRANAARFTANVREHLARWAPRVAKLRGLRVVAYHRSFTYLANWLGLEVVEHLEPKPGVPPSPAHVARVIGQARSRRVSLVLQESYYPTRTGTLVAGKIGGRLVRIPGGPEFASGESYLHSVDEILRGLEGKP